MASLRGDPTMMCLEEEDIRGDGKKKNKFKPLSAVRKLFGGKKRKKEDTVVAVKARSTTALHSEFVDTDDDDGGFKSHQTPLSLAGTRSISEDSIFTPDVRGDTSGLGGVFTKSALSEESLPKNAFQSELLSKLSSRGGQFSDDDHDDGLPRSPVPPVTTADVFMGGGLKPTHKKANNRDSDQSLISVGSENDEEDLFTTKWKASIPSKKAHSETNIFDSDKMEPLDLGNIEKTEVLKSSALKDRMSIKPKGRRGAKRQSTKKRLEATSPMSLPSLNEESPTKVKSPIKVKSPVKVKSPINVKSPAKVKSPVENTPKYKDFQKDIRSQVSSSTKTDIVEPSTKENLSKDKEMSPPSQPSGQMTSQTSSKLTRSPVATNKTLVSDGYSASKQSKLTSSVKTNTFMNKQSSVDNNQESNISSEKGFEGSGSYTKLMSVFGDVDKSPLSVSPTNHEENISNVKSALSPSARQYSKDGPSLRVSEPDTNITPSPKNDYKLKRQNRSKTLPGGIDEQASPKIQRAKSHRLQSSPLLPPREPITNDDKVALTPNAFALKEASSVSSLKKTDPSRFASPSTSAEPSWMSRARKIQEENVIQNNASESKSAETSSSNVGRVSNPRPLSMHGLSSKSAFSLSHSNKSKDEINPSLTEKSDDIVPSKEYLSSKRESIEIDVSKLGTKTADNKFSGNRGESSHRWSSQIGTRGQANIGPGSVNQINENLSNPSTGATTSHLRSGSVKTSPTKTFDNKPGFMNRGSSVKISSGPWASKKTEISTSKPEAKQSELPGSNSSNSTKSPNQSSETFDSAVNMRKSVVASPRVSSPVSSPTSTTPLSPLSSSQASVNATKSPTSLSSSSKSVTSPSSTSPASGVGSSNVSSSLESSKNPVNFSSHSNTSSSVAASSVKSAGRVRSVRASSTFTQSPGVTTARPTSLRGNSVKDEEKTSSSTPSWRAGLNKRKDEVKIEIIENKPTSTQAETGKKIDSSSDKPKKMETPGRVAVTVNNRSSKVLDMVKNFQNLQVSS